MGDAPLTKIDGLRKDVERKDRRFRAAQTIFMTVVIVVLLGVLAMLYNNTEQLRAQVNSIEELAKKQAATALEIKHSTDELKKDSAAQSDKVIRYVECLAQFFATTDRANRVISDLQNCVVQKVSASWAEPGPQNTSPQVATTQGGVQNVPPLSGQGGGQISPPPAQQPQPQPTPNNPPAGPQSVTLGDVLNTVLTNPTCLIGIQCRQ